MKNILNFLKNRNFIFQITDKNNINKILSNTSINLYCGFDPTANSLHIGHLILICCLKYFKKFGHNPLILIGGATSLVGDPSFKKNERKFNNIDEIQFWSKNIKKQILSLFNNDIRIENNINWFNSINIISFLRNIGKYFSVNQMINKEYIKTRINKKNKGISFLEFSYNLLQSYDFAYLYKNNNVILQIGGADQWGHIVSGIHLVKKMYKKQVYGITLPLINNNNGIKFGKTENDTIWLDPKKTSPYKFYQYWLNIEDNKIHNFLKIFTFLKNSDIEDIYPQNGYINSKSTIKAHKILAEKITTFVHGEKNFKIVKKITNSLFKNSINNLSKQDILQLLDDGIPSIKLVNNIELAKAIKLANLASSITQAKLLIKFNSISINGKKQTEDKYVFTDLDRLFGRFTFLKKGKKTYCLIDWII